MSFIKVPPNAPGILGPMMAFPNTAAPLNALADSLLGCESSTFSKAERELVASYVSYLNECIFCSESHGAVADFHYQEPGFSRRVWQGIEESSLGGKMQSLLKIAKKVQTQAKSVTALDIQEALEQGASEADVHDAVLIAAAFCMFNRYVDGLGTMAPPRGDQSYAMMGEMLATKGYGKALD